MFEVFSLTSGSTIINSSIFGVSNTDLLPQIQDNIDYFSENDIFLRTHDAIIDGRNFLFSANISDNREKKFLHSLPIPPFADIINGVKLPRSIEEPVRCTVSCFNFHLIHSNDQDFGFYIL